MHTHYTRAHTTHVYTRAHTTHAHATQLYIGGPSGLVSFGEAAHQVVTSMDTWHLLGKQMPNCPCIANSVRIVVELWVP